MVQQKIEIAAEAARAAPPVAVAGATLAGVPLNTVVLVLTIVYLAMQIGFLIVKWVRLARGEDPSRDRP